MILPDCDAILSADITEIAATLKEAHTVPYRPLTEQEFLELPSRPGSSFIENKNWVVDIPRLHPSLKTEGQLENFVTDRTEPSVTVYAVPFLAISLNENERAFVASAKRASADGSLPDVRMEISSNDDDLEISTCNRQLLMRQFGTSKTQFLSTVISYGKRNADLRIGDQSFHNDGPGTTETDLVLLAIAPETSSNAEGDA
jgi:hypothetical protein